MPIGMSVGLGAVTELQVDSGYQWLAIERRDFAPLDFRVHPGDHTSDVIDVTLAMKVRVLARARAAPAFGLRFATELPNASNESGLGLDTLNFVGTVLAAKTMRGVRLVGNAGVALLSDVLQGSLQHDAFVGSVSVAYALRPTVDLVGELAGRQVLFADRPPIGAEPRGQVRGAVRFTRGPWRADAGLVIGTTRQDPDLGAVGRPDLDRPGALAGPQSPGLRHSRIPALQHSGTLALRDFSTSGSSSEPAATVMQA